MNASRIWILTALPLALAACGGGDDDGAAGADTTSAMSSADSGTIPAAPMPADTTMASQPVAGAVTMNAVGNSGVTGQASFMEHGAGQTMVTVNLTAQGSSTHSGHIHQGTCDSPGQVVAPLQDVTLANGTGSSTSTVAIPLGTVMNGQHIVAYHQGQGDNAGPTVVCGQIPAQQAGAATDTGGTGM